MREILTFLMLSSQTIKIQLLRHYSLYRPMVTISQNIFNCYVSIHQNFPRQNFAPYRNQNNKIFINHTMVANLNLSAHSDGAIYSLPEQSWTSERCGNKPEWRQTDKLLLGPTGPSAKALNSLRGL